MRRAGLPHQQNGEWWFVSPWSGSLFRSTHAPYSVGSWDIPLKVTEALAICDRPYFCSWSPQLDREYDNFYKNKYLDHLAKFFALLGNKRFFLLTHFSRADFNLFSDTREAFAAISRMPGLSWADDNCLQRSLLAAMTSKSFGSLGVLFVGAELSTGDMHAWIIENGTQPDGEDRSWVNYRPLLALYK